MAGSFHSCVFGHIQPFDISFAIFQTSDFEFASGRFSVRPILHVSLHVMRTQSRGTGRFLSEAFLFSFNSLFSRSEQDGDWRVLTETDGDGGGKWGFLAGD